jgi:hypothetical protein
MTQLLPELDESLKRRTPAKDSMQAVVREKHLDASLASEYQQIGRARNSTKKRHLFGTSNFCEVKK